MSVVLTLLVVVLLTPPLDALLARHEQEVDVLTPTLLQLQAAVTPCVTRCLWTVVWVTLLPPPQRQLQELLLSGRLPSAVLPLTPLPQRVLVPLVAQRVRHALLRGLVPQDALLPRLLQSLTSRLRPEPFVARLPPLVNSVLTTGRLPEFLCPREALSLAAAEARVLLLLLLLRLLPWLRVRAVPASWKAVLTERRMEVEARLVTVLLPLVALPVSALFLEQRFRDTVAARKKVAPPEKVPVRLRQLRPLVTVLFLALRLLGATPPEPDLLSRYVFALWLVRGFLRRLTEEQHESQPPLVLPLALLFPRLLGHVGK